MTITSNDTKTIALTVPAPDLINALKNASAFMSKDSTLPVLNGVNLVIRDGQLLAEATDRYKMIEVKIGSPNDVLNGTGLEDAMSSECRQLGIIPTKDLKMIEAVLKTAPKHAGDPVAMITAGGDGMMTFTESVTLNSYKVTTVDGSYPNLRGLFKGETCDTGDVTLAPDMFKAAGGIVDHRVTASRRRHHRILIRQQGLHPTAAKPVILTAYTDDVREPWVRALLMPIRHDGLADF